MIRRAIIIAALLACASPAPAQTVEYMFSGPNQTSPDQTWSGSVYITPDVKDGANYYDVTFSFVETPSASTGDPGVSDAGIRNEYQIFCGYCGFSTRFDHDGSGNLLPWWVDGALIVFNSQGLPGLGIYADPLTPADNEFRTISIFIDRNAPGCDGCGTANETFVGSLTPAPGPVLGSALPGVVFAALMSALMWGRRA